LGWSISGTGGHAPEINAGGEVPYWINAKVKDGVFFVVVETVQEALRKALSSLLNII
jgi:hypothetical protein